MPGTQFVKGEMAAKIVFQMHSIVELYIPDSPKVK
jgi:hypothetical protein